MRSDVICIENRGSNVANIRLYKTNIVRSLNSGDVLKVYYASDDDYFYYKNSYNSKYVKVYIDRLDTNHITMSETNTDDITADTNSNIDTDDLLDTSLIQDNSQSDAEPDRETTNSTDVSESLDDIQPNAPQKKRRGRKSKEEVSNND